MSFTVLLLTREINDVRPLCECNRSLGLIWSPFSIPLKDILSFLLLRLSFPCITWIRWRVRELSFIYFFLLTLVSHQGEKPWHEDLVRTFIAITWLWHGDRGSGKESFTTFYGVSRLGFAILRILYFSCHFRTICNGMISCFCKHSQVHYLFCHDLRRA